MAEGSKGTREVWSCRLCPDAPEEEAEKLESALLSRELSIWEDAEFLQRYIALTRLSQAACAKRLGRSQAAVANRLRILKLPADVRAALRTHRLTERHARALLRLSDDNACRKAAAIIVKKGFSVTETEDFVETLLSPDGAAASLHREQRQAVNTLWDGLSQLQSRCPGLDMEIREEKRCVVITLRLPKV